MYRAGGAVSAKAPGKGAFALGERSSSGAIGSRLSRYPKTSAGDPRGHGNRQSDPHRRTGRDAGRDGGTGSDQHEQFDGSDPPNQPPEERERRIQDEIGERQYQELKSNRNR